MPYGWTWPTGCYGWVVQRVWDGCGGLVGIGRCGPGGRISEEDRGNEDKRDGNGVVRRGERHDRRENGGGS